MAIKRQKSKLVCKSQTKLSLIQVKCPLEDKGPS